MRFNSDWPWTERSRSSPITGVGNIITAKIHIWRMQEALLCIKGITDCSDSLWNSFLKPNILRKHPWPCFLSERSKRRFKQTSFKPLAQQTLLLHYKICLTTRELILSTCLLAKLAKTLTAEACMDSNILPIFLILHMAAFYPLEVIIFPFTIIWENVHVC